MITTAVFRFTGTTGLSPGDIHSLGPGDPMLFVALAAFADAAAHGSGR